MGKTKCLGCGKSLGGVLDGFRSRIMAGDVCLSCKKKIETVPNYQYLSQDQIKDLVNGVIRPDEAVVSMSSPVMSASVAPVDTVPEQIRQYKELCDDGIITMEEFEEKKRQLLGL